MLRIPIAIPLRAYLTNPLSMHWIRLQLCSLCLACSIAELSVEMVVAQVADDVQLDHTELFDRTKLLEVEIELRKQDWDTLRKQSRKFPLALMKPAPPNPFEYFKGDVTINGERIEGVGIRKKGFLGSLDDTRPSLKIKFDEFKDQQPVAGLERLTLNNNKQDRAFSSAFLSYQLFADAQLPASRCSLAHVTVNGTSLGIYSHVESVKKSMLARQFGDNSGKLYEGTLADVFVGETQSLEAKTIAAEQREELESLAKVVTDEDKFDVKALAKHVDLDHFFKFWAMESLVNFWDGYTNNQNNYFMYHSSVDDKFRFMPWGLDCALIKSREADFFDKGPESVHGISLIANRLYKADGMAERYRESLERLLADVWDEAALLQMIDETEQLVEGKTHRQQRGYREAMQKTRQFVRQRRRVIERELKRWPMKIQAEPRMPPSMRRVGKASGKFKTVFMKEPPKDVYDAGETSIVLTVDGEPVEFKRSGIHCTQNREQRPKLVLVGKRQSNGIRITLSVNVSRRQFKARPQAGIRVDGKMAEGAMFLNPGGIRIVSGTLYLEKSGTDEDAPVEGRLEVDIVKMVGMPQWMLMFGE